MSENIVSFMDDAFNSLLQSEVVASRIQQLSNVLDDAYKDLATDDNKDWVVLSEIEGLIKTLDREYSRLRE